MEKNKYEIWSKKKIKSLDDAFYTLFNSITCPSEKLSDSIKYIYQNPGKRIRPLLVLAAGDTYGADSDMLINLALSIELIHNYSLIHDDLPAMDNDDFRRGLPTLHKKYDEATAILAGDAFLTLAFEALTYQPMTNSHKIINFLARSAGLAGMVGGQSIDIEYTNKDTSYELVKKINSFKTGKIISSCIVLPIFLVKDSSYTPEPSLVDFSNDVGLIFQLVDDLLDGISSFEKMGKKVQKDQINKKNTGFTILGVEGLKKEISLISDKIDNYIKENNLTGTYLDYIVKFVYQRSY